MSDAGWKGRTEFEDLFVADAAPPPLRGGVDAKLEHVRTKLKRMETMLATAKKAWHLREREMDHLEVLVDREHDRADNATREANKLGRQLHELQEYLLKKKGEFDEFSVQLRSSFAEQHHHESGLRQELAGAKAEYDELAEASDEEIEALRSRVIRLDDELSSTVRVREDREEKASHRIKELQSWVGEMERDLEESQESARRDKGELNKELVTTGRESKKWQERAERYKRRVKRRERTIDKLEARLEQRIPEWTIYTMAVAGMALILFVGMTIATPSPDQTAHALCLLVRPEARDIVPVWVTVIEILLVVIALVTGGIGIGWAVWVRRSHDGHRYR